MIAVVPAVGSSVFTGLLSTGLIFTALGAVLALGIGVAGNPVAILFLAIIHLIDDDLGPNQSRAWFFVKSILKLAFSAVGAFLAGISGRSLNAGFLPTSLLPMNVLPGTSFATGMTAFFVVILYYHVYLFLAIHTDDGYGMILSLGLSQFIFGLMGWSIWQIIPNLNYLFLLTTATGAWNGDAWWDLGFELVGALVVVVCYYVFFRDVFSRKSRLNAQANNLSDDVGLLLDTQQDGSKTASSVVGSMAKRDRAW